MVMEEEPSPEFVGREFVRQYYTVLHACPENLHRFYSTDSSFVHGGVEQPENTRVAKGQAEIHKRIMSLNLRECRAKIRQVDSFETVNGALVIQVIGELGNGGESMRRFVQTFVLVQQSPKSYYVNNDIFRYQDDVFRDEENEASVSKVSVSKQRADDAMDSSSTMFGQSNQDHHLPSSGSENYANGSWPENEEKRNAHPQTQNITAAPTAPFSQQQQRGHVESQQPTPFEQQNKQRQNQRNERERERVAATTATQLAVSPKPEPETVSVAEAPVPAKEAPTKSVDHSHESRANTAATAPAPNKPLTFAAVAGGGRTSPVASSSSTTNANNRHNHATAPAKAVAKPTANAREKSPEHSTHGSVSGGDDSDSHQVEGHRSGNAGGRTGNYRAAPSYPNEQQVFVGNLPQDVTDEELQEFMTKFGAVVEVKIVNKPGRQQGGRVTPAFAFVTFEHVEAVDKIMNNLPINDFRGHMRLNIERKQDRERSNNFYSGQGGNYRSAQQGGGPGSGRGGMRGGIPGRRFPAGPRGGDNRQ